MMNNVENISLKKVRHNRHNYVVYVCFSRDICSQSIIYYYLLLIQLLYYIIEEKKIDFLIEKHCNNCLNCEKCEKIK